MVAAQLGCGVPEALIGIAQRALAEHAGIQDIARAIVDRTLRFDGGPDLRGRR